MSYKIHSDLKPLSANLKKLRMGSYLFGRDLQLELEEYDFDELWADSRKIKNQSKTILDLSRGIDFEETTEIFIVGLDLIYRSYCNSIINKHFKENFNDFFYICFEHYIKSSNEQKDFSKILEEIYHLTIFEEELLKKVRNLIKNKKYIEPILQEQSIQQSLNGIKYQIFISSTFIDLKEERQAAVEAILKKGHIPAGMELFTAGNKSQWEVIKKWIDDSDIYLLILGGRYGSIDKEIGLSYTEMEYNYAIKQGKPFFALILSDKILDIKPVEIIRNFDSKDPKYISFKENVKSKMCSFPDNIDQIKNEINHSLDTLISEYKDKLKGWIKGN